LTESGNRSEEAENGYKPSSEFMYIMLNMGNVRSLFLTVFPFQYGEILLLYCTGFEFSALILDGSVLLSFYLLL